MSKLETKLQFAKIVIGIIGLVLMAIILIKVW